VSAQAEDLFYWEARPLDRSHGMIWGLSNLSNERAVRDSLAREYGFASPEEFQHAYPELGIIRIRPVMNQNGLLNLSAIF
jgi:hypothetical protein